MKPTRKLSDPQIVALRAAGAGGDPFTAAAAAHRLRGTGWARGPGASNRAAQSTISSLLRRSLIERGARCCVITDAGRAVLAAQNGTPTPAGDGFSITAEMPALTPAPIRHGRRGAPPGHGGGCSCPECSRLEGP